MADVLEVLVPLYLATSSYIEYSANTLVTITDFGTTDEFNNPTFNYSNFIAYLPEFTNLVETDKPYNSLFEAYNVIANQKLSYQTFGADWYLLMSLYIAHNMQLIFKTIENKGNYVAIGNDNMAGVIESGKGGEVEYKINPIITDNVFKDAGEFNLTQYGKRFWSTYQLYGRLIGKGLY